MTSINSNVAGRQLYLTPLLHERINVIIALGDIRFFVVCDVIYLPFVKKCGIQDPRAVWDDLVDPATMSDSFTSKQCQTRQVAFSKMTDRS